MEELKNAINALNARFDSLEKLTSLSSKEVINVDELMLLTGFCRHKIYLMTHRREIPFSKRGGKLFFEKSKINQWLLEDSYKTQAEIEEEAIQYAIRNPAKKRRT